MHELNLLVNTEVTPILIREIEINDVDSDHKRKSDDINKVLMPLDTRSEDTRYKV